MPTIAHIAFACLGAALAVLPVQAQHRALPPAPDTLVAADYDALTFVPQTVSVTGQRGAAPVQFEFDLSGFPAEAEAAIRFAGEIWATHLESAVPVRVRATFEDLDREQLGFAGPACVVPSDEIELPIDNTWYAVALAESILGRNVNPVGEETCPGVDVVATFNRSLDVNSDGTRDWYFGTDGNPPPGRYDFATVVLHELGHGLGFIGSFEVVTGEEDCPELLRPAAEIGDGCWGLQGSDFVIRPFTFDRFAEDASGTPLLDESVYPNPSPNLGQALRSEDVFFDGPTAVSSNGTLPIDLYAPANFEPGSSFSHLDESVSPPGTPNSLMTPQLARAEAIFSPGPFTCALMSDVGWALGPDCVALLQGGLVSFSGRPEAGDIVFTFRLGIGSAFTSAVIEREVEDNVFEPTGARVDALDPEAAAVYTVRLDGFAPGSYTFRLRLFGTDGTETLSVPALVAVTPDQRLAVFPNPFSETARVVVDLSEREGTDPVRVVVYDVLGRRVTRLFDGTPAANSPALDLVLDGSRLTPGVYFVRAEGASIGLTQTVTRVR